MSEDNQLVIIYSGNPLNVGLLKSMLEDNEITVYLKDEVMGTFFPWYGSPGGAGAIKMMVETKDLERAEEIVQEFLDSTPDSDEY